MGSRDLTDGAWVWPEALAHYVDRHAVTLPEQFVTHAISSGWGELGLDKMTRAAATINEVSDEIWIQWAAARRWPQVLEQLRAGRRKAEAFNKAKQVEEIADLERDRGLATTRCQWRDCQRNALADLLICAEHFIGTSMTKDHWYQTVAVMELHSILAGLSREHGHTASFPNLTKADARDIKLASGQPRRGKLQSLVSRVLSKFYKEKNRSMLSP
jgi:hypothetical protein